MNNNINRELGNKNKKIFCVAAKNRICGMATKSLCVSEIDKKKSKLCGKSRSNILRPFERPPVDYDVRIET